MCAPSPCFLLVLNYFSHYLLDLITSLFSNVLFSPPKLMASNECLEKPHCAPGPRCYDATGNYWLTTISMATNGNGNTMLNRVPTCRWKQMHISTFRCQVSLTWYCYYLSLPHLLPPQSVSVMSCWPTSGGFSNSPEESLEKKKNLH